MNYNYTEIVTQAIKNDLSDDDIFALITKHKEKRKKEFRSIKIKGISESFYLNFARYCVEQGFDDDDICELIDAKIYLAIDFFKTNYELVS